MNRVIEKLEESQVRKDLPVLRPGDTVRVHVRLKEAEGLGVWRHAAAFQA